jgi:hypothetical protein
MPRACVGGRSGKRSGAGENRPLSQTSDSGGPTVVVVIASASEATSDSTDLQHRKAALLPHSVRPAFATCERHDNSARRFAFPCAVRTGVPR